MSLRAAATGLLVALWPVEVPAQLPPYPNVISEELPSSLRINGLSVEITHLSGTGVPGLVRTLAQRWRVAAMAQGDWLQLAHQSNGWSEVLQWRPESASTEALYSRLRVDQSPGPPATLSLQLPAVCQSRSYLQLGSTAQPVLQLTARCEGSLNLVQSLLLQAAKRSGWRVADGAAPPRLWTRSGLALQLDVLQSPQGVVVVALQHGRALQP